MKKILLITFIFVSSLFTFAKASSTVEHFKASAEQFAAVPVTQGNETEWRTIYFLPFNNLRVGDVLQVMSEGQVRNNLGFNVELAQTITISANVYGGTEDYNTYAQETRFVSPVNGSNITPGAHYGKWTKVGTYEIKHNDPAVNWQTDSNGELIGNAFICMRVRARSTAALPGNQLDVNVGQGFISALKISN